MDRLTDQDNCDKQGKAIAAMFRCVVRLEVKGCDFYCDGSGYGGERNVIHQGWFNFSSIKKPFRTKLKEIVQSELREDKANLASIAGRISGGVRLTFFFFWGGGALTREVLEQVEGFRLRLCRRENTFNVRFARWIKEKERLLVVYSSCPHGWAKITNTALSN